LAAIETCPSPRIRDRYFAEVVAGIIERDDRGEEGVRERAAAEVLEEAGHRVQPDAMESLGGGSFPSPGALPEKFYLMAVEVPADAVPEELAGDGSPMEEGARTRWMGIDEAIAAFESGALEDAKSEVAIRRLRDRL